MNDIELLQEAVIARVEGLTATIAVPVDPLGSWFLDVRLGEGFLPVEWRARHGDFGLSTSDDQGYGDGPEEIFDTVGETADRIVAHLTGKTLDEDLI